MFGLEEIWVAMTVLFKYLKEYHTEQGQGLFSIISG